MTKDKLRFKLEFKESSKEVHIIPTGKWDHPAYGEMEITPKDIKEFKKNFDAKVRKGVPITAGHDGFVESAAMGWVIELVDKGKKGLFAIIEWTKQGKTLLEEKSFKYFSPEYYRVYEDPETRKKYENVLTGGALTNSPYFKKLKAVVFSDQDLINFNEKNMNIEEILKKDVADLTDEDKATLKTADLTDDQKDKYKDILEDDGNDSDGDDGDDNDGDDGDDKGGEGDKDGDDDDKGGDNDKGGDDKGVEGSEVKISASELQILKKNANAGAEAMKKLNEQDIEKAATKFEFSESNQENGKFLPKSKDKVVSFMCSLNKEQSEKFQEILTELPKVQIFGEIGDLGADESKSAMSEIDTKIKELQKEDAAMTYSDALKSVLEANPELSKRYDKENK